MVCPRAALAAVVLQSLGVIYPSSVSASLLPQNYQHYLSSASNALTQKAFWSKLQSSYHRADREETLTTTPTAADEALVAPSYGAASAYDDEALWRIHDVSDEDLKQFEDEGFDIWQVRKPFADLRVSPEQEATSPLLRRYFESNSTTVISPSLSSLIQSERTSQRLASQASLRRASLSDPDTGLHSIYHSYSSIESLLSMFASDYPNFARLQEIGKTPEGRSLWSLRISDFRERPDSHRTPTWREYSRRALKVLKSAATASDGEKASEKVEKRKLGMALLGGQHAREWISPAALLYAAHSLLVTISNPSSLAVYDKVATLLADYELHFIPVANPDGYDYSWTTDRLWQRTRQDVGGDSPRCTGIDMNRNWAYKFEKSWRPNPCSDLYAGTEPFQSQELKLISEYLLNVREETGLQVFTDIHSFGQMLMYPYSYSCSVVPPDAENLYESLLGAAKAIHGVHRQQYEVGSVCDVSYTATGQSLDWTYHTLGARWSFAFNLRDQGVYAFLLPPDQILPTGQELLGGLLDLAEFIAKKEKVEPSSVA